MNIEMWWDIQHTVDWVAVKGLLVHSVGPDAEHLEFSHNVGSSAKVVH